ncbi:hypothetical protein GPJ56_008909 [Histomonas meleagridis]|uniref:uncharacterized protein n=1 Tax=Histomonas meleagridis TaxID=135588 RepID=UPI00355A84CB|nr:hypothetical protein GPJ56_008909 [Histomonas meleagridis]KAH0797835.1 hypothetical protein GO595_009464 [Histomonas meleagridis]
MYMKFGAVGIKLSKVFQNYSNALEPLLLQSDQVIKRLNASIEKFDDYQAKLAAVKKEDTPENLLAEKESVIAFSQELTKFHQESNLFRIALLSLFDGISKQFCSDITSIAEFCSHLVVHPEIISATNEELELDDYIIALMKEEKKLPRKARKRRTKSNASSELLQPKEQMPSSLPPPSGMAKSFEDHLDVEYVDAVSD